MPTFNQLVRKGRQVLATKSTAPALLKSYNSQKAVPFAFITHYAERFRSGHRRHASLT